MSPLIMLKNTTLNILQMSHLKFKSMLLHQSHLYLSLKRKRKIKMFALIIYTFLVELDISILFGKLNICQVGLGCLVNESTSV